ncbi:hypothetical protein B0H11DRAFT_1663716, partial [Mycena galericulata]
FPPGPGGVPILGNAFDLPRSQPCVTFSQWAKEYGTVVQFRSNVLINSRPCTGPIVHLRVFGKSISVLNEVNDVTEMLDRKSRIYTNRPVLQMGRELVGW